MFRIAIMVRLAGGATDRGSHAAGTDQHLLYPLLSEARAELQPTLKNVTQARQDGHMDDDYPVTDYFLHDTQIGRSDDVAWAPAKDALLIRMSHEAALSQLVKLLAEPACPAEERAFLLDVAKTALEFGLADHRNTVTILCRPRMGRTGTGTRSRKAAWPPPWLWLTSTMRAPVQMPCKLRSTRASATTTNWQWPTESTPI